MDWEDLLGSLRALVIALADMLPADDVTSVEGLIDGGEPGVALENLCTQLYEYEAAVTAEQLRELRLLAMAMDLNPVSLESLEKHEGDHE